MIVRNCAGGIVFNGEKVFLLKNEKDEWVFPKGVIRGSELPGEVALKRVSEEAGINAEILSTAGQTSYEFFSVTRQRPVCNKITWYLMKAQEQDFKVNRQISFKDGGYFDKEKAIEIITYSQDKALLNLSYNMLKKLENLAAV